MSLFKQVVLRAAAVMVIFVRGAMVFSGCGTACEGSAEVPASWTETGFKVLDGGSVCANDEKQIVVDHGGYEMTALYEKYKAELKSDGWTVTDLRSPPTQFDVVKNRNVFSFQLRECDTSATKPSTWAKCTSATIIRRGQ